MSFGVFDAAVGSEHEVAMAKQASVDKLAAAIYDCREQLGPVLFASRDVEEFRHKIAMMKDDQSLFKIINAAGLFPLPRNVRKVTGALQEEFTQRLADMTTPPTNPVQPNMQPPGSAPTVAGEGIDRGLMQQQFQPTPGTMVGRRRRSVYDTINHPKWDNGTVDTNETFQGGKTDTELKPKGDFKGYLKSVDQGAKGKIKRNFTGEPEQEHTEDPAKHNFASKEAVAVYRDWCAANNLSPARLSSLDRYADNLSTGDYFRLAQIVMAWDNEHKPKVPKTKLPKTDKVATNDPMRAYSAWCRKHGLKRISANNIAYYAQGNVPLTYVLAYRIRKAVRIAHKRQAGRRTAAPDYLQKADDALTQLLNQKAEEFQETIAPLQQALITVQQAEQLQQTQNPLNVLPPPGTVNVMPGQPQSPAAQIGMPDPNQPDISGLVQALQPGGGAMGGIAPQEDAPVGGSGGAGAPPPAAAGGGLPPDLDQSAQKAARRGKGRGAVRPRQAAGIGEQWDRWKNNRTEQGDALRGDPVDYERFQQETGAGERAMNKLRQRNQSPDWEPVNRTREQGITVGRRRRQACWPGCHENEAHAAKFHKNDKKESRRRRAETYHGDGDVKKKSGPFAGPNGSFPVGTKDDLDDAKDVCNMPSVRSKHPGTCDNVESMGSPKKGQRKQAWSGWGPAVVPRTRHVAGWDWDDHLNGYLANKPQHFACACNEQFPTPSGFHRCKCGRQWNSYVIGTGGNSRQASAEKFIVREVPVRPDVIVANRKVSDTLDSPGPHQRPTIPSPLNETEYFTDTKGQENTQSAWDDLGNHWAKVQLRDPRTGAIHTLVDPGEIGQGEDPQHPTFRKQPKDWARRGGDGKWTPSAIG